MTRVGISRDERFPTYFLSEEYGEDVGEVDDETLTRWGRAIEQYNQVQDEMESLYEGATERRRQAEAIARAEKAVAEAQAKLDALRTDSGAAER